MQRSVWARTFSSPACVHAIESSDDGSHTSSAITPSGEEESRKKINKKIRKLLLPLKHRQRISRALRSLSWGAKKEKPDNKDGGSREEISSDVETTTTFVSANSSELRSSSTDIDDSEPPSFRVNTPPIIFPTGSIERSPPASPLKIVRKLPFGYVIGRQLDVVPAPVPPSVTTLARRIKKAMPLIAASHLRSQIAKMKVCRALKEACCRRRRQQGAQETDGSGGHDDEDVFWKKDVKGLRCRPLEDDDDDAPY